MMNITNSVFESVISLYDMGARDFMIFCPANLGIVPESRILGKEYTL